MATAFHRDADIAAGFGAGTVSGLALYLLIYSLLGALFAIAMRDRLRPFRLLLGGVAFAVAWYYISFGWIWNKVMPTVASLHVVQATVLGHVIYGTALGRYPLYLSRLEGRQAAVGGEFATEAAVPVVEHVASDPIDGGTQAPPVE